MRLITEPEFKLETKQRLAGVVAGAVTGPGRSGAVAAVYASYLLGIPFIPYGQPYPGKLLVVDTVSQTGKTIRKATAHATNRAEEVVAITIYTQQERLYFWYEQQHENSNPPPP
jgi:hypoxanthine phosphoribosyltransferase